LSQLTQGTLYTHSVKSSFSCLFFGCTSTLFCMVSLPQIRCAFSLFLQQLQKRFPHFHIRNNNHWPLQRIMLLSCLLVPLGASLCWKSTLDTRMPKGLFYMENYVILFSIFNLCNEALTSFQQSSHHTQFMFNGVVRAEVQILISVGRFPIDL